MSVAQSDGEPLARHRSGMLTSRVPRLLIYGTFMRGQPGHDNMADATYIDAVETAPRYRLWEVDGRWPALIEDDDGVAIAAELYETSDAHLGWLVDVEPPGWRRSRVELADGSTVEAFVGDPALRARGVDVSAYGGWIAYRAGAGGRAGGPTGSSRCP